MDEALEEHHVAHILINELKRMSPSDDRYEAKFTVLGESIKHHVKEEEETMFPKAENADIDWDELNQKAMERKDALAQKDDTGQKTPRTKGQRKDSRGRGNARKAA